MTRIDGSDSAPAPCARPGSAPERDTRARADGALRTVAFPVPAAGHARDTQVNCFTPGTLIATPRGATAIETLTPGDMVITRDNGPQEIRWAGRKRLAGPPLRLDNRLQPILIQAGALGPGVPERDLHVSPNHRVLLLGDDPGLDVAEAEVFVSARHLVGTRGIGRATVDEVTYLHFMCDRHEVVLANGAWTESFQPSDDALQGVSDRAREELFALFPELSGKTRKRGFGPARLTFGAKAVRRIRP